MQLNQTLNEICKVSAVKATTALSKFLHAPIGIEMRSLELHDYEDIRALMSSNDKVVSLAQPLKGDITGGTYLLYPESSALNMCDILFHRDEGRTKTFSEAEKSALSEIANIVIGNFLTSLAQTLQVDSIMHHRTTFTTGPFGTICHQLLSDYGNKIDQEIVGIISFSFQHISIRGYVIVVFDKAKVRSIIKDLSTSKY